MLSLRCFSSLMSGNTVASFTTEGRLITRPMAPFSPYSIRSTTVSLKFGSCRRRLATRNFPFANSSLGPGPPGSFLGIAALNCCLAGLGPADSAAKLEVKKVAACKSRITSRKWDTKRCAGRLFLYVAGFSLTTPFYNIKLGMTVEISRFSFTRK